MKKRIKNFFLENKKEIIIAAIIAFIMVAIYVIISDISNIENWGYWIG